MGEAERLAFVPYAIKDHDAYTAVVAEALAPRGIEVTGVHSATDPRSSPR